MGFTATRFMTATPTFTETTEAPGLMGGAIAAPAGLPETAAEILAVAEVLAGHARAPLADLAGEEKREAFPRGGNPALAEGGSTVAAEDFTVVAAGEAGVSRVVSRRRFGLEARGTRKRI